MYKERKFLKIINQIKILRLHSTLKSIFYFLTNSILLYFQSFDTDVKEYVALSEKSYILSQNITF